VPSVTSISFYLKLLVIGNFSCQYRALTIYFASFRFWQFILPVSVFGNFFCQFPFLAIYFANFRIWQFVLAISVFGKLNRWLSSSS
jgi:hypothetical protein